MPDNEVRPYLTGYGAFSVAGGTAVSGTGTAWASEIGSGVVADTYLALALRTTGSDGVTEAGSNVFEDTVTGFSAVEVGDSITLGGTDTYEVLSVDSPTEITLDGTPAATATGVAWENVGALSVWGQVASVTDDDDLVLTTGFSGTDGDYYLSLLDTDYREAFHDTFLEQCPEEDVEVQLDLSPGYRAAILSGRLTFTSGSPTVEGDGDVDFLTELGGGGVQEYICAPDGTWYLVVSVTDIDTLVLSTNATADFADVTSHLLNLTTPNGQVLAGTCGINNNSYIMWTTVDHTVATGDGMVSPNDWVQILPHEDLTAPTVGTPVDTPVVQVQAVFNNRIILKNPYPGVTALAKRGCLRAATANFPPAVPVDFDIDGGGPYNFSGWYGTAGGQLSNTVPEL